jgi:aspartyl-tRNA(Asn)/glutamyl-tRNA(Gln) amidotransferase subunit B
MFCGCAVVDPISAEPNSSVCPICLGMPGTLPVVNKQAVEFAVKAGLALHCQIAERSIFARKNYFYPDLPKGYQISQYEYPITHDGWISIALPSGKKTIRIVRAHLEEDTGKLNHYNDTEPPYSLVDLNRAGIPLLEIVTEPDMHCVEDVRAYSQELRLLLRHLDITSGDMEKGAMRFEANVSMRESEKAPLGPRVEIKNLNSIHIMEKAIAYELERQEKVLKKGGKIIQETLGWNEADGKTFSQRSKEEAHDYRYFPEPDLPPLLVSKEWIASIAASLPELPDQKRTRYTQELALSAEKAEVLIQDSSVCTFFEELVSHAPTVNAAVLANWVLGDIFSWMNESGEHITELKISASDLAEIIQFQQEQVVNKNTAKEVLKEMLQTGTSAQEIIQKKGLEQITSDVKIEGYIQEVLEKNPEEVDGYRSGKENLFNWLFGQVMQAAQGKADPQKVRQILKRQLEK